MTRILVIEDDTDIALSLKHILSREGSYEVSTSPSGDAGLREAIATRPDLVILDLSLPGMDGTEVCRRLRAHDRTAAVPIVMLTARAAEGDRIAGLDGGADDYVTKPFSVREVLSRVRAVLRRSSRPEDQAEPLTDEPIRVEPESRRCLVDGREVALTRREFDLLAYLLRHRGRVVGRERLLERVWGYDYPGETRTVDVHVRRLRKKLGPGLEDRIETLVGVGYRYRGAS